MCYLRFFFNCFLIIFFSVINDIAFAAGSKNILVIVPLEHKAMSEIIEGIQKSLSDTDSKIIVKNAHGDVNLMLSLIKQIPKDVDLIMPIGIAVSQMTVTHVKNKPIICVAADLKSSVDSNLVTGVSDEISAKTALTMLPKIDRLAVIYSATEKTIAEIDELKIFAKAQNIELTLIMAQSLVELPVVMKNIPNDVQAFFMLKDHLVVSAINSVVQEANKRKIPIIASDEGSVINGALLAIGIKEYDIGFRAGLMAKSVMNKVETKKMEYQTINDLTVFYNKDALNKQKIFTEEQIKNIKLPLIEFN